LFPLIENDNQFRSAKVKVARRLVYIPGYAFCQMLHMLLYFF